MDLICEYYNIPYYQHLSIKKPVKSVRNIHLIWLDLENTLDFANKKVYNNYAKISNAPVFILPGCGRGTFLFMCDYFESTSIPYTKGFNSREGLFLPINFILLHFNTLPAP